MKKAFSLMELMVVIIILGLLAMFVLPNLTGKSDEAKEKLVCIQMKSIGTVLKHYKLDNSFYPSTQEGLEVLKNKNYFEDGQIPVDSWKNNYVYVNNGGLFDLISYVKNNKFFTEVTVLVTTICNNFITFLSTRRKN